MKIVFDGGEFICYSEIPENENNNLSISESDMFNLVQIEVENMYQKDQLKDFSISLSLDGKEYHLLGEIDQSTESHTQGRNKITSKISFETQEVISLKIKSKSLNPIPPDHHRAGEASRIYLDEVVIF